MISSPLSPAGNSSTPVFKSTILASVFGYGIPILPCFFCPMTGLRCVVGEVSDIPNPSNIVTRNFFSNC
ncbi:Uncharacterised protein [Chlamydia trachomatis]|nr:Uncharacterised protein [Chlamydia trachomatis]